MTVDFEKYAFKGNEFVSLVADDLEIPKGKAGRIIRAVFHALRNRLSHEESFQLLALLPMVLKGVYVEGWKYDKNYDRVSSMKDFLDEVRKEDGGFAGYDFGDDSKARVAVAAVFRALHYFAPEQEMNDIADMMPGELEYFIRESYSVSEGVF